MARRKKDFLAVAMLIIAGISIYLQIFPPRTEVKQLRNLVLFVIILTYVGIAYLIDWSVKGIRAYINQINQNKEEIDKIKESMKTERRFNEMDKRISVIESLTNKTNKKGSIVLDPRWIALIILLVLFYLYLRSFGLVP